MGPSFGAVLAALAALVERAKAQSCVTNNVLDATTGLYNLRGEELGACAYTIATGQATCADDYDHGAQGAGACNFACGLNLMDVNLGPEQCSSFIAAGASCADYFAATAPYAGYCDFECGYCTYIEPLFNCEANEQGTVYVGGLFDSEVGSEVQNSPKRHFEFAASMLSDKNDGWFDELLPGISISTRSVDTDCDHVSATSAMWGLSNNWVEHTTVGPTQTLEGTTVSLHGVIASISCEEASAGAGTLTRLLEIPLVSAMETSPTLSDREAYPFHFRMVAPEGRESQQLKAVLARFAIEHIGIMYTDTPDSRASTTEFIDTWVNGPGFRGGVLSQCKVRLNSDNTVNINSTQQCFGEVNALPKEQRPRCIVLAASSEHAADIINAAVEFYLPGGFRGWDQGKIWIGLGNWVGDTAALRFSEIPPSRPNDRPAVFLGLTANEISAGDCSDFHQQSQVSIPACTKRDYLERWVDYQRNILGLPEDEVDQQLCDGCAETVDALLALISALNSARCDVAAAGLHNLEHGDRVKEYLRNVTLIGLTGQIGFDESGDRATSRFDIKLSKPSDNGQWRRVGTLIASSQGGVELAEEEPGDASSAPTAADIAAAVMGTSSNIDNYGSDLFCTDGTQCLDPALPHCDVDYDPDWRWEPGAVGTVDGVPRNVARGTCVNHTDFVAHTCAAPMYLYQSSRGSTHHMTLYGNETTSCYQKNSTTIECRKGGRQQSVVPEPANVVAGMCAEYLPSYMGTSELNAQREVQVCCRLGDRKLETWFFERWQDQDIRFGQCENCRNMARKVLCQTACDVNNWRFHASSKVLSSAPTSSLTASDAVVCPQYCKNSYKACRDVIWSQDIKHMPQYKTLEDPESGMFRFCKEGLRLEVATEESWNGLGGAWSVDENDPMRICTENSEPDPVHCTSDRAYRTKGAVGTILCIFAVVALLGTDKITNRMMPSSTITLIAGFVTGFLIDNVFSTIEEDVRGTHDLVNSVLLKPEALGLFLLPVIIFSMAFNIEHHVTIFMWLTFNRISMFAIISSVLSIVCTGGLLLALDGTLKGGLLEDELSIPDAMMFSSLINALDPAPTLAVFARLGADPRTFALIHGESLVSRCVSVVLFGTFKQFGISRSLGEDGTTGAGATCFVLSVGSMVCGVTVGVLTALFYKKFGDKPESADELEKMQKIGFVDADRNAVDVTSRVFKTLDKDKDGAISVADLTLMDADGDGQIDKHEFRAKVLHENKQSKVEMHHKRHRAVADACVFVFSSFSSYFAAETLSLSGIMSSSICALVCNQFAVRNMTFDAREYARSFYVILSEVAEQMFMLWVGVLYYMSSFNSLISTTAIGMGSLGIVCATRLVVTIFVGTVHNQVCGRKTKGTVGGLEMKALLVLVAAGLRGPVALALVTQMPTSAGEYFLEAVYFVTFWSNMIFGGLTAPLVTFLGISNEVDGSLDLADFQFTEEEAKYLEEIETTFARIEDMLLVHAGQTQTFSTSDRGRHASLWEHKVQQAKNRGAANLTDKVSKMPKVKNAQRALDRARADKMPGKSATARQMIIKDLERALKIEEQRAARNILDSSVWDMSQGVSDTSQKAELLDTSNPVFQKERVDSEEPKDDD